MGEIFLMGCDDVDELESDGANIGFFRALFEEVLCISSFNFQKLTCSSVYCSNKSNFSSLFLS